MSVHQETGLAERSVRRLFRRFEVAGKSGAGPDYARCGQHQSRRTAADLVAGALQLRQEHPTWGAPLIVVMMKRKWKRRRLPSARSLQRWFQQETLPVAPAGRRPATVEDRAQRPHEVWQMDASEEIALRKGGVVSWLRVVDEFTGAVLQTTVFAEKKFPSVGARPVQQTLRQVFKCWGRPQRFRVDNGSPWGSHGDLPTDLALWLIGLGVSLTWNPPHQPQKNGVVERSQGVGKNWVEPARCASREELQRRLQTLDRVQREEYPYRHGLSRIATFPELKHSGRPYHAAWEKRHWDRQTVLNYVANHLMSRRVDQAGMISIYNRGYYVGTHHRNKTVYITLDAFSCEWIILDERGQQLRSHAAEQLTAERIQAQQVTHRRCRKPK